MRDSLIRWYWWSDAYFSRRFGCAISDYIKDRSLPVVERYLRGKKKILDAACGSGNMYLEEIVTVDMETTGLDIDPGVRESNKLHGRIVIGDMHEYRPVSHFDAILSLFTWEHLHAPEKVLQNFNAALVERGVLIIVASNKWYYISAIDRLLPGYLRNLAWRMLKGRKVMPYPTFYRLCTKKTLISKAQDMGFRCVHYETFDMPPMWFMGIPPLFVAMCSVMALFNRYAVFEPVRSTFIAVFEKEA
jgi:SAM-dependent methyltransferase